MRNIANVVHDLEAMIKNHHLEIQMLLNPELTEADKMDLVTSILQESNLLKDYIASLKAEALSHHLKKAEV